MGKSGPDLTSIVEAIRNLPGVTGKSAIHAVSETLGSSDWVEGPGDDGAVVPAGSGDTVVCGEAILSAYVAVDPRGAESRRYWPMSTTSQRWERGRWRSSIPSWVRTRRFVPCSTA